MITVFVFTLILFTTTLASQEVNGEEDLPFPVQSGGTGSEKAIPDWVDQNFRWYGEGAIAQSELVNAIKFLIDNNIMVIDKSETPSKIPSHSPEWTNLNDSDPGVAQVSPSQTKVLILAPTAEGESQTDETSISGKYYLTIATYSLIDGITYLTIPVDPNSGVPNSGNPNTIELVTQNVGTDTSNTGSTPGNPTDLYGIWTYLGGCPVGENCFDVSMNSFLETQDTASEKIKELVDGGETDSKQWEDVIDQLAATQGYDTTDSVVDDLAGIVVLCSTAIDKEIYALQAEILLLQELSDMHVDDTSIDTDSTRSIGDSTEDMDGVWWGERLSKVDQKIKALQTGLEVLEEKLSSTGDDAQLANIDLQNSLQKQQQTLQTLSNILKSQHDTLKAIISNVR